MTKAQSTPRSSLRLLPAVVVAVFVAAGAVAAPASAAVTYEVDRSDDDASANACTGAANDCSLRGAIRKANVDGQESTIVLPDGTYQLTIPGADENSSMTGDLDVFAGNGLTIEAAPGASPVIEQTEADRVFELTMGPGSVTFLGPMTITGGSVTGSGGLISSTNQVSLTIEGVDLEGGQASIDGGCLDFRSPPAAGTLSLTEVTISGCNSGRHGGGLHAMVADASTTFDRVVVEDNTAVGNGGGVAILNSTTTVLFVDCTIQRNVAEDPGSSRSGGGLYLLGSAVRIERSTVAVNSAGGSGINNGFGGGLAVTGGSDVTLRNSTVSGNVVAGTMSMSAAIDVAGGSGFSTLLAEQSTIIGDPPPSAEASVVGINSDATVTFEGSIVEGGCYVWHSGSFASNGFNVERPIDGSVTTECGLTNPSDVLTSSPLLKPLAGYGGPTETHALMAGAPAVWLVPSTYCRPTDQRLAPRGGLFCDAGSFESGSEPPGMWLFSDSYESGNTLAWSSTTP